MIRWAMASFITCLEADLQKYLCMNMLCPTGWSSACLAAGNFLPKFENLRSNLLSFKSVLGYTNKYLRIHAGKCIYILVRGSSSNTANHGRPLILLKTHVVLVRVACGSNILVRA